jgi:hypothetical protein
MEEIMNVFEKKNVLDEKNGKENEKVNELIVER